MDEHPSLKEFRDEEEREWLFSRVMERTQQWEKYEGLLWGVFVIWFRDGVEHRFERTADWQQECFSYIMEAIEDASRVRLEAARLDNKHHVSQVYEMAKQMASNERFTDAKNEAKRAYMAGQLFPEEDHNTQARIAALATLYHWWYLEPVESSSSTDKARQLYDEGYSMADIAKILKISPARVKKAIIASAIIP